MRMRLPEAHRAVVDERKVREYLVSFEHPVGRFKAAVFHSAGYTPAEWRTLQRDLIAVAESGEAELRESSAYGRKYVIRAILQAPRRPLRVTSVWPVPDSGPPRFITAFPG